MSEIALITGASAGIGKAFALQLAPRCKAMILVSRDASKLNVLAQQLQDLGVRCVCIAGDLTDPLLVSEVVEAIRQQGPVSILVNNAGFSTHGLFAESDIDAQQKMVNLHCNTSLALCRAVLPYMRQMGRGQIINVASLGSFFPMKKTVVYGASKAFLVAYSQGLAAEMQREGIRVQCLCPGYTHTEFHDRAELSNFDKTAVPDSLWSSSEQVVAESLRALDQGGNVVTVIPGESNVASARSAIAGFSEQLA